MSEIFREEDQSQNCTGTFIIFLARFSWTLISKKAAKIFFYLFGDEGPGSFGSLDGQAAIFKLFSVYCR